MGCESGRLRSGRRERRESGPLGKHRCTSQHLERMRAENTAIEHFEVRISWVSSENSTRERFLLTILFPLYARCSLLCYSHMPYNGSLGVMALTGRNCRSKKRVNIRSRIEMGRTFGSVSSRIVTMRPLSSLLCDLLWLPLQSRPARQGRGRVLRTALVLVSLLLSTYQGSINDKSIFSTSSTRCVSLLCLKKHTNTVRRVTFVLHL